MEIEIQNIGNSKGVVLPESFLAQAGLDGQPTASVAVENGCIILRRLAKAVRAGGSEAVAAKGGNVQVIGEYGVDFS